MPCIALYSAMLMPSCAQRRSLIAEARLGSCCSSQRPFSKSPRRNEVVGARLVGVGVALGVELRPARLLQWSREWAS